MNIEIHNFGENLLNRPDREGGVFNGEGVYSQKYYGFGRNYLGF
jgi:hypothetical protein